MTHSTHKTTHFTMPAILPAILTGLFILTACGGGALPNDGKIAPNTQNDACKTNPLAEDCQNHAKSTQFIGQQTGFLSVGARGSGEDTANQEAESNVAPPAPKPVVNAPVAPPAPTPVVKKTEPVLKELAKKQTPPTPAPITQADTYDFAPQTSYSTYSSPAPVRSGSIASGDQAPSPVTAAGTTAFTALESVRDLIDTKGTPRGEDDTGTQQNQFLQGGTGKIDSTGAYRGDSLYMNLGRARYNGDVIGGDSEDGIDFYTDELNIPTGGIKISTTTTDTRVITVTRYHYAGILSGTDLGAPVATSGVTAIWYGSFRTHNARNAVDFELTVGFGTTEQDRTISAFVKDNAWQAGVNDYYLLAGNYDENGLITGTVNFGEFTGGERTTPANVGETEVARTPNGILKGLIGVEGAVGVFVSGSAVAADGKVTGGTGGTVTIPLTGEVTRTYGFSGGFVASATLPSGERVLYNDWAESFDDPTTGGVHETPSLRAEVTGEDLETGDDTFTSDFLGIREGATELDTTGAGTVTERGGLTLAGDTDSGVSFFGNGISLATLTFGSQSYAGLLAGTDLGAPINDVAQVGEWKGQFKSIGGYYYGALSSDTRVETAIDDTDFTLTVTFSGGTGTVNAFVPIDQAGRHFYIAGTYDANGVISGDVRAANFNFSGTITRPTGAVMPNDVNGVLTGLIGVDGAVGAFHSNKGNYNYAGGFVATLPVVFVPTPDDTAGVVSYADWVYGQELNSQEHLSFTANTVTPKNEFLAIRVGDDALDETGLATTTTTRRFSIDLTTIGRTVDGTGGFSIFTHGGVAYAGILPNTDLGAPLGVKDVATTWRGGFYAVGGYEIDQNGFDTNVNGPFRRPADFELEITFGGTDFGTIKGSFEISPASLASQARGDVHFLLEGTFNAGGYITGTVNFGKFDNGNLDTPAGGRATNGVLTGIIGKNGAVGAFISNPVPVDEPSTGDRNFIYSGGFAVARDNKPNYATFREFYTPRSDTKELHATHPATGDSGRFIEGTETGLVTDNFDLTGNGYGPAVVRLGEVASGHADYGSGFAVMRDTNNRYRVGLLSGTDLGAALDASVTANWSGKIYRLTHTVRRGDALTSNDLTLTVDFADGTIETTDTTVRGRFNTGSRNTDLPFGILDGSVNYGSFNVLAGLIGEKGVLGVFHGGVNGLHAGGFYATPDEEEVVVTYGDDVLYSAWESSFASGVLQDSGVNASGLDLDAGYYIKLVGGNVVINGSTILSTTPLRLNGATTSSDDGYESGFGYAYDGTNFQSFAGLLPTTNVGGALESQPAEATWEGTIGGQIDGAAFNAPFKLNVTFVTAGGTLRSAFGKDNIDGPAIVGNNNFDFTGTFNEAGVMSGTVDFNRVTNGTFNGLIGAKGAVGVFKDTPIDDFTTYSGGFVVSNPDAPSN